MFGFLNASMSGATARFLSFELGKGNFLRLKKTFSSALIIHIGIALIILIIAETLGLWFLNHKLVIPADRIDAAQWAYQFSILSTLITITQAPYNASIIAHEKMTIYAYVEILNVTLKLLVVYLLVIGNFDKLILYSFFIFTVSTLIALIYRLYCIRHFNECRFHWIWDTSILKPMLSFSGWDLYGNMSVTVKQQGLNMLLNIFWGPLLNSANGVATSVQGAILGFSSNIITAAKPQIIKSYAESNIYRMKTLIYKVAKYSCLLMICISVPFIIEMETILSVWLKTVPPYSVTFCRILLVVNCITTINFCLNIGIHATGNIKLLSFISGSLSLMVPVIAYLAFKIGANPEWGYIIALFLAFITIFTSLQILKKQIKGFSYSVFIKKVLFPCICTASASYLIGLVFFLSLDPGLLRFTSICISCIVMIVLISLLWADTADRQYLHDIIRKYYHAILSH